MGTATRKRLQRLLCTRLPALAALVSLASRCHAFERVLVQTNYTNATSSEREAERQALVTLYEDTNGEEWVRQGGWLEPSTDHCDWEGVVCDTITGSVTELRLEENALTGSLKALSDLSSLSFVDMRDNELWGPTELIGNLVMMRNLSLANNALNGTLGELQESLTYLDLSGNELYGEVKQNGRSNLTYLNLADNNITAINLTQLTFLQFLDLHENVELSQPMSHSGIGTLSFLQSLNLGKTNFSGPLDLRQLIWLELLDLSTNELLTGSIEETGILNMTWLKYLDLGGGGNRFSGAFSFVNLTSLEHIVLEGNGFSGSLTGIGNSIALRYCDLRDNNFSGPLLEIGQLESLEYLDLRRNNLSGDLFGIGLLTELRHLHLGENRFTGVLPVLPIPLQHLNLSHNELSGTIPDLSQLQSLEIMDLSQQYATYYNATNSSRTTVGITGPIPSNIQLFFLQELILSGNLLTGSIPEAVLRSSFLRVIDLEDNAITGTIPPAINILAQLDAVTLARNRLFGPIPNLGSSIKKIRRVTLQGNPGLETPAPYELCDLDDLDLRQDEAYCPSERSALAKFYTECQGPDWNNDTNWIDPEKHHCTWFGVGCTEDQSKVLSLVLISNGVSGQLPAELFNLQFLQIMDLTDNDVRGRVPSEIGKLNDLKKLRLSYNQLTGLPTEFEELKNLSLVHFHGNRLTGDDSRITLTKDDAFDGGHQFISDCGDPTDAVSPFECDQCDMCCNSLEECQEPISPRFNGYQSAGILVACAFALLCVVYIVLKILLKRKSLRVSKTSASEACGAESVYSFFLTKSYIGWFVTLLTVGIQVAIFGLFLQASSFSSETSDFVYSWRCPRNTEECDDERTINGYGWTMWGLLVFASVTDDLANGIKLICLSASRSSKRCFISGAILFAITALSIWTSAEYNRAIAVSNTEIIVNAVILLFVNDIDDQIFSVARVLSSKWTRDVAAEAEEYSTQLVDKSDTDRAEAVEKGSVAKSAASAVNQTLSSDILEERQSDVDMGTSGRASFLNKVDDENDVLMHKIAILEHDFSELRQAVELQNRRLEESA